jgi:SnoaL-like domain
MKPDRNPPVADEFEILRLLATLAQATDDRDESCYRACFADDVTEPSATGDVNSWRVVSSQEYTRRSMTAVSRMAWTHHKLCNPIVDVTSDRAWAKADVVVDMETVGGGDPRERVTVGGRYDIEFIRLDDKWRISKRRLVRRYVIGDPTLVDPDVKKRGASPINKGNRSKAR